jgi:PAS domain S-box-containing protein
MSIFNLTNIVSIGTILLIVFLTIRLWTQFRRTNSWHILILNISLGIGVLGQILESMVSMSPGNQILAKLTFASAVVFILTLIILVILIITKARVNWRTTTLLALFSIVMIIFLAAVLPAEFVDTQLSSLIMMALSLIIIGLLTYLLIVQKQLGALFFLIYLVLIAIGGLVGGFSQILRLILIMISYIFLAYGILRFSQPTRQKDFTKILFGRETIIPTKISTKINLTFFGVFLMSMILVTVVMQTISSQIIREEVGHQLETAVQSRAHHVNSFLEEQEDKIRIAATHSSLTNEELREMVGLNREFYEIFTISKEGVITASSDESHIGLDRSQDDYFIGGMNKTYIKDAYLSSINNQQVIAISTPHAEGVLVARISTQALDEITTDKTGLGETGEIYLINQQGLPLTSLRFKNDAFLNFEINTENARHCLEMISSNQRDNHDGHIPSIIFQNYKGGSSLGSHYVLTQMDWCLLAEIDEKEALAPTNNILIVFVGLTGAVLIIYYILGTLLSRAITRPIERLQRGAEIIQQGDLSHKVGTRVQDEVGQLSRAFDQMTTSLKVVRSNIEQKIIQQTEKITDQTNKLQTQQSATLNILEDVEEEKNTTIKERDKINAILHSIGDGVFVVDKDLNITIFNQVAADICGCDAEDVLSKKYDEVLKFVFEKDGKKNDRFIVEAMSSGEVKEMSNHTLLIRNDGVKVPVADSAAPLKDADGNVIGCVVVFRDVSKQRELDDMKTDFMNIAAHDLRTPVTAIKGFAQMIREGDFGTPPDGEIGEALRDIEEGSDRMISLVNDFLTVSRFEQGRLRVTKKAVDLKSVLKSVDRELQVTMRDSKVKLKISIPNKLPEVDVDEQKIIQVLVNLADNSIKHTEQGSVEVKATVYKDEPSYVLVTVSDTGAGIQPDKLPHIFERYFKGKREDEVGTGRGGGIGLGLYIVKIIIDRHGGKVWAESEVGKGTTVKFTIPVV